jgi:hypothetical protein
MRRFLLHVLPRGFHRIRHYGLLANATRAENLARARQLLAEAKTLSVAAPVLLGDNPPPPEVIATSYACPRCGGRMIIIEFFERAHPPRAPPLPTATRS